MNVIERITRFIDKTLNTKVSPMVYIMTCVSVITGFGFCFLSGIVDIQNTLLFKSGEIGTLQVWGFILMCSALAVIIGLYAGHDEITKLGAFGGFLCWLFACWTYLLNGYLYALVSFGLFHLLFYGYVFLATSMGYIRRKPLNPRLDRAP